MIIIIEKIDEIEKLNHSQESALECLLWAYGRGNQVLWMPIDLIEALLKKTCFSDYAKRALVDLKTFSRFSKNLLITEFDFRVVVDFSDKHKLLSTEKQLTVGYEIILDEKFLLEPVLLTENEIDAKVYTLFAKAIFSSRKNLNLVYEINIEPHGGGGSDTIKTFERLLSESRLFVCLLDSDIKHPKGPLGETAKHFALYPKGPNRNSRLEILNAHEIENLIPIPIIEHLFAKEYLGHLFKHANPIKFKKYPDHKNGFLVEQAKKQDMHHGDTFWKDFYHLGDHTYICAKLNSLTEQTKQFLENTSTYKIQEFLDKDANEELFTISNIIASWGVKLRRRLS
ncbi:hypothetical protein [Pseudomonas sp. Z4-20]|uniref:hypothetical protein n=1 Tax=Pseudomonas sp. Z4-20 TaxID=2817414 RepID=UPI003DA83F2B